MFIVTGGAGFIGSNIVAALEDSGRGPVVVVDRLRSGDKWQNIAKRNLFDVIDPDHLDEFLNEHASDIEAVIHMGAISATTERDADKILKNNFQLSKKLWHWCSSNEVRYIYASSAATYGDGNQGFEDDGSSGFLASLHPMNAYGWSKHLFDRRVADMIESGAPRPPQWAGLKFFNVYGPNEYHKGRMASVVSQVFPVAKAGEACQLFRSHRPDYEDGGQLRDFIWVGDCVNIVMWLLDNRDTSGLFNCGSGKARSFSDLAKAVYGALDKNPNITFIDTPEDIRDKYQYFTEAPMARLRACGYDTPMTSLEDGVRHYVTQFLNQTDIYR
jgi:ADP-L-glycero-D-manno-heptose 6-epimerase